MIRNKEKFRLYGGGFYRACAFMMSMALTFTSVDTAAFAMKNIEKNETNLTIVEVEKLADEIKVQELDVGDLEKDIEFPEDLKVSIQETQDISDMSEEEKHEYKKDIPVTWELDKEKSSKDKFSSDKADEVFVYNASPTDEYELATDVVMPQIKVNIQRQDFYQVIEKNGVVIEIQADKGVFPANATAKVKAIEDNKVLEKVSDAIADYKAKEAKSGKTRESIPNYEEEIVAFDITIHDESGKEIQPNNEKGEVRVSLSELSEKKNADIQMFCIDDKKDVEILDTDIDKKDNTVEATAEHFSIYGASIMSTTKSSDKIAFNASSNVSAKDLIDKLIADDEEDYNLTNMKKTGTVYLFDNGTKDIGLKSGIVLDTSGTKAGGKDAQLNGIRDSRYSYGGHTSTLEFTAKANGDLLNFNYVFASGEFNQGERYNDCFGLFVKINNGSWKNIAQITRSNGTKVPVTIKNIRAGITGKEMNGGSSTNLAGYHSLFTKKTVQLNGTTNGVSNIFNAQLPVTPGDIVTVKFAICDISDSSVNSWVFIEGDSLNFKGPKKTMTYTDKDGNEQVIEQEEGELATAPEAITKEGYNFLGWNTKADGSGKTYQPGEEFPLTSNINLYPTYEQIKNTTEVQLLLDGKPWSGQKVTIYADSDHGYTLEEKSAGSGIYVNSQVVDAQINNGDYFYDIYVNDRLSDKKFKVHPMNTSLYVKEEVNYAELNIETKLDDVISNVGKIGLYKDGSLVHEFSGNEGKYVYQILESEGSYDIYVDGVTTGKTIGATDTDKSINFYEIKVAVTDDALWKNAKVELKDSQGDLVAVLDATKKQDKTVTYSKVLVADEEKEYSVFIEGLDTHKDVTAWKGSTDIQMSYYTATVKLEGNIPSKPVAVMTNGYESYEFEADEENICVAKHVMVHEEQGKELAYQVSIKNTVDNAKETVKSSKKDITLTYRLISMLTCTASKNDKQEYEFEYDEENIRKTYVRHGSTMPPYKGTIELVGHAFDFWSEEKWDSESQTPNTPFDFAKTKIEKDYVLYANYAVPTVIIGEVINTDEAGTIKGNGAYYRMANLTITGFDKGEDAVKYIFLTTDNTEKIKILDTTIRTSDIELVNGTETIATTNSGNIEVVPTTDKVAITFKNAISMSKAQDFLCNQIIVSPKRGTENGMPIQHTMKVEVMDGEGSYVAANGVNATATTATATELKGSTGGEPLSSGNYYLTKDATFKGNSSNRSGITIASGAKVYIYIPQGVTLTAQGYYANGQEGAGAGINVPYNSVTSTTLVLLGEGTVKATGGNAASGGDGNPGEKGTIHYYGSGEDNWYETGNSGAGGYGGGGAGAGIGGIGGIGGDGGSVEYGKDLEKGDNPPKQANGTSGNVGGTGTNGESCGNIYILGDISVVAKGGDNGYKGGNGGQAGIYDSSGSDKSFGDKNYHVAGGGGGGGGGGAGYSAYDIGSGGPGGGGGASGGSGAGDYNNDGWQTGYYNGQCGGEGGYGGNGSTKGSKGLGTRDAGKVEDGTWDQYGGFGGSGGSAGNYGNNGTTYVAYTANLNDTAGTSSETEYNPYDITFTTPTDTSTVPESVTYNYGQEYILTFPEYNDSNSNVIFLGWQIKKFAKSGEAESALTTKSSKRYMEGDQVLLHPTTHGDIEFVAVTEEVNGIFDDDKIEKQFENIDDNEPGTPYYTYNVKVLLDNEIDKNRGKITIGGKVVTPSALGVYSVISTTKEKLDICIDGIKVGETSAFGLTGTSDEYESLTTIEYESIQVEVEGTTPDTVELLNGPTLLDEGNDSGNRKYSCERLKQSTSDSWDIIVNGENSGKTASYGNETVVDYNTVTVNITKQGNAADTISSVELRDSNNASIFMNYMKEDENEKVIYDYTKLESDKEYTLYINGDKTDIITSFSEDKDIDVTYSRYCTVVHTKVDGKHVDMGTVFFGDNKMIRNDKGIYEFTSTDATAHNIIVDGKTVRQSVTPGEDYHIEYFTLSYDMSGTNTKVEEGELPQDNTWYLSGEQATLQNNISLTNGWKTFDGWKIGDTVYKPGDKVAITSKTIAKANWVKTSISETAIDVEEVDFTYNGESQVPEVKVSKDGVKLKEDVHYKLSYTNSNGCNEKGANNTINAGNIKISIEGIGDFKDSETSEYKIEKRDIILDGVVAEQREYDGTTNITLDRSNAVLTGKVEGDVVYIERSNKGHIESPSAGDEQIVVVGASDLKGAAKDNYELRASKTITVVITKKQMEESMFALDGTPLVYDATEKKPGVTATDMKTVDGKDVNIISAEDFTVTYENNINAGTATAIIKATEEGNYSGTVTKTFSISKAPITLTAQTASSEYGAEVKEGLNYSVSGTIYTEADKQDLDIKVVTSVKKGYDANTYKDAITINYKEHPDYEVKTVAADYTVTKASNLEVTSYDYKGMYDGEGHSIRVAAKPYKSVENITVYYSRTELTLQNYASEGTEENIKITDAGTHTVYYYAVSPNYVGQKGSAKVIINKAPLTVKAQPQTITYGQDASSIIDRTIADLTIEGFINNESSSDISENVSFTSNDYKKFDDVGTYSATPLISQDVINRTVLKNYEIKYVSNTLTVKPKTITFKWSPSKELPYTGSMQGIYAQIDGIENEDDVKVGSYVNDETYKSSAKEIGSNYNAKVASIIGRKAHNYTFDENAAGLTCNWSIVQGENKWKLEPSIQGWVAGQTPNEPIGSALFGKVTYTYSTAEAGDYSATKPTTPGSYYMKAYVAGTDSYKELTETVSFNIEPVSGDNGSESTTKPVLYVTAENVAIKYGENAPSNIKVTYSVVGGDTVNNETITGPLTYTTDYNKNYDYARNVGEYMIMPSGLSSTNYEIVYKPGTLTVEPREVGLIWSDISLSYTGNEQSVIANLSELVYGDNVYVSTYEGNTKTDVGSYTATAKELGGTNADNYKLPDVKTKTWSIAKTTNEFTITPTIEGWTYGESASIPSAKAKFGAVKYMYREANNNAADAWKEYDVLTGNVPKAAGNYDLKAFVEGMDGYDSIESGIIPFTIAPAKVVITAKEASHTYGANALTKLEHDFKVVKGVVSKDEETALNIKTNTVATNTSDEGRYPITISYTDNPNISVETIDGTYTISKGTMTDIEVVANDVSETYDGQPHGIRVSVKASSGNGIAGTEVYYSFESLTDANYGSGSLTSPTLTDVGEKTIYYYVKTNNYKAVTGNAKVTITKKDVTVTANDSKIIYGDEPVANGVTYDGFVNGETAESLGLEVTYAYEILAGGEYHAGSSVGEYQIIPNVTDAPNYNFNEKNGKLTVIKKTLDDSMVILNDAENLVYDGTEKEPSVTVTDARGVSLVKDTDYTVKYENNMDAGEAKVIVTATDNGNYTGTVTKTFNIAKKTATITANSASSVYNDEIAELSYTSDGIVDKDVDSLNITPVTSVKKGYDVRAYTDAISINYTPNDNYDMTIKKADYTVTEANLTVTAKGYTGVYDGEEHSVDVSVKTGKYNTYAQIYYGTQQLDGTNYSTLGTIASRTFKNAGTYTVYYYVLCNNYTSVAGSVDVVINKAPLDVKLPSIELTYGDEPASVISTMKAEDIIYTGFVNEADASSIKENSNIAFSTTYAKYGNIGNYDITASGVVADNYDITYKSGVLTVNKKDVTISWPEQTTYVYDGKDKQMLATIGGTVNNDVITLVYASETATNVTNTVTNTATNAGTYTAKVSRLNGEKATNYNIAEGSIDTSKEWTIDKVENSWISEPSIVGWTVGATVNKPSAIAKYGTVVFTYSSVENGEYSTTKPTTAGSYYMKAKVAESTNYTGLTYGPVAFEIIQASGGGSATNNIVYVEANDVSITYGTEVQSFTYTIKGANDETLTLEDVATGTVSFDTDYTKGSNVGTYTVVPKGLTAINNYTIVYKPGTITVNQKELSLTWSTSNFVYDGTEHTVTASVASADLITGDSVIITEYESDDTQSPKVTNKATNAGTYTAKVKDIVGTNLSNYIITDNSKTCTWTIVKAGNGQDEGESIDPEHTNKFIIYPSITGWTYGDKPNQPVGSAKYGTVKFEYSTTTDGTYTDIQPTDAGTYYMKATVEGTDNYAGLTSEVIPFTIAQAPITVIVDDKSSMQGEFLKELTYTLSGKVKDGDDLAVNLTTEANANSEVGRYPITVSVIGEDEPNYNVTTVRGYYFITPKSASGVTVTAEGYTGVYDGQPHGITVSVTNASGEALHNAKVYYSETLLNNTNYGSGQTVSPTFTDACEKTIHYYVVTDSYEPIMGYKTVSIKKKEVAATAKDNSIVYGEEPAADGVTYDGFIEGDIASKLNLEPTFTYTYNKYDDVGSYKIMPTVSDTANYTFKSVEGNLTVTPKPVTFTWSSEGFEYDASEKSVTAQVEGTVNNDIVTVESYKVDKSLKVQNKATIAGEYKATVDSITGDKSSNYMIEEDKASHRWSITKGTNFFTVNSSIADWIYGESAATPYAESEYGSVYYQYSDKMYGEYTSTKPTNAGTYYMKAIVDEHANYEYLESTPVAFTIHKAEISVIVDDKSSKKGEDIKELSHDVIGNIVDGVPTVQLSTTATKDSEVGVYSITATVTASENYKVSVVNGQYYITEDEYTIKAEGANVSYDGNYHSISVRVTDETGRTPDDVTVYYSTSPINDDQYNDLVTVTPVRKDAGTLTVYYRIVKDNTVIASGEKSVVITRVPLTVKANDAETVIGNDPRNNGVMYKGFVNGENDTFLSGTLSYEYDYIKGQDVGKYIITPSGLMSENYDITYEPGVLTVLPTQKDVDIIVEPLDGVYNGKKHLGYKETPNVPDGEVIEFEYNYEKVESDDTKTKLDTAPIDAGKYRLTVSIPKENNYYRGQRTVEFEIAKCVVTLKVNDQAMLANKAFVSLEPECSGFVEGDINENQVFNTKPTVNVYNSNDEKLTDVSSMAAGTYELKVESLDSVELCDYLKMNYEIKSAVDGKLVVLDINSNTGNSGEGSGGSTGGSTGGGTGEGSSGNTGGSTGGGTGEGSSGNTGGSTEGGTGEGSGGNTGGSTEGGSGNDSGEGSGGSTGDNSGDNVEDEFDSEETGGTVDLKPEGNTGNDTKKGIVKTAVIKEVNAPKAHLEPELTEEKAKELLTSKELEKVENGDNALIYLLWDSIEEHEEHEYTEETKAIEEKAKELDCEVGEFLDVSLYKVVGDDAPVKLTDLNDGKDLDEFDDKTNVFIKVKLPENLINKDPKVTRTYHIIYEHDGVIEEIVPEYFKEKEVLTFEAHKFSVYSIVYKDTESNSGSGSIGNGGNTGSGDQDREDDDEDSDKEDSEDENDEDSDKEDSEDEDDEDSDKEDSKDEDDKDSDKEDSKDEDDKDSDKEDSKDEDDKDSDKEDSKDENGKDSDKDTSKDKNNKDSDRDDSKNSSSKNKESNKNSKKEDSKKEDSKDSDKDGSSKSDSNSSKKEDVDKDESEGKDESGSKTSKKAEVVKNISKKDKEILSQAMDMLIKEVPNLQVGPYVQLIEGQDYQSDKEKNTSITVNIPEDISKEGRTYYVVTVDKNGKIVVLESKRNKDGSLTFTGDPGATYQVVYENGKVQLANMINEKGWLVDKQGNVISVDVKNCFCHYIIIILTLIGIAMMLFFKGKKKRQIIITSISAIIMFILIFLGDCKWEILCTIIALIVMVIITILSKEGQKDITMKYDK